VACFLVIKRQEAGRADLPGGTLPGKERVDEETCGRKRSFLADGESLGRGGLQSSYMEKGGGRVVTVPDWVGMEGLKKIRIC